MIVATLLLSGDPPVGRRISFTSEMKGGSAPEIWKLKGQESHKVKMLIIQSQSRSNEVEFWTKTMLESFYYVNRYYTQKRLDGILHVK